jgi:hypothetical protein
VVDEPVEPDFTFAPIYHIGEAPDFTKLTERELNGLTVTKLYDDDTSSVVGWGGYAIGNHFLTLKLDGGKITETIKFLPL